GVETRCLGRRWQHLLGACGELGLVQGWVRVVVAQCRAQWAECTLCQDAEEFGFAHQRREGGLLVVAIALPRVRVLLRAGAEPGAGPVPGEQVGEGAEEIVRGVEGLLRPERGRAVQEGGTCRPASLAFGPGAQSGRRAVRRVVVGAVAG